MFIILLSLFASQAGNCSVLGHKCCFWWSKAKEIPGCLIHHLLVVFTRQLKNLVTALCIHTKLIIVCCRLQGVKKERLLVVCVCRICCGSQMSKNVLFRLIMISLEKSILTRQFPVYKVIKFGPCWQALYLWLVTYWLLTLSDFCTCQAGYITVVVNFLFKWSSIFLLLLGIW